VNANNSWPTFTFAPLISATDKTRVTFNTCIFENIIILKKKKIKKKSGNVRRRHSFLASSFFRNSYMPMLAGLSQQTTPMTTRLKFHGKLHGLERSLIFSLSLPLSLSLSLSLEQTISIWSLSLRVPTGSRSSRLPLYPIPVARLSHPPHPPPLIPVGWLVRDRSHPRFLIHPHLHRLHPQPVSRYRVYICDTGCIQPLPTRAADPPCPFPAWNSRPLVSPSRQRHTVLSDSSIEYVLASSLRPFPKIATKTSPLIAPSSYTGSRH